MIRPKQTALGLVVLVLIWVATATLLWRYLPRPDALLPEHSAEEASATPEQSPTPADTETPTVTPSPPTPTATPLPPLLNFEPHQLQSGETMQRIAALHHTSMALLGIYLLVDDLTPGNIVLVPVPNLAACPSGKIHVVEENQTLASLARLYNTSAADLMALNHKGDELLFLGDILCIP